MIDEVRTKFEGKLFAERFLKSIKRNENKPKYAISDALDFVSVDCPNKDDFFALDANGDYQDKYVSAMWFGYQLALKD